MAHAHQHGSKADSRFGSGILVAAALLLAGCAGSGDVEKVRQERTQAKAKMSAELQQERVLAASMEKDSEAKKAAADKLAKALGGTAEGKLSASTPSLCPSQPVTPCFIFKAPKEVANKGVYAAIFGQITEQPYIPASGPQAGTQIPKDTFVYFMGTDYATVPPSGSLPLVTLFPQASPSQDISTMLTYVIQLPGAYVKGGAIVISVGSQIQLPASGSSGGAPVPTAASNPTDIYGLFEYTYNSSGLDVDLSQVDQVGFPFTITSDPVPPFPAQDGVGMPLCRMCLFKAFQNYSDFAAGKPGQIFMESYTQGNINGVQYRLVSPQDILAAIEGAGGPTQGQSSLSAGGNLPIPPLPPKGQPPAWGFCYWVTATSATGETPTAPGFQFQIPYNKSVNGQNQPQATVNLNWQPFSGATGYNIYRLQVASAGNCAPTNAKTVLVGSSTTTTFADTGGSNPLQKNPPAISYGYDPLSTYYTAAIQAFFNKYTQTNSFTINVDGTTWTGNTVSYKPSWAPQTAYTALQLKGQPGGKYAGKVVHVYQPLFSTNTNNAAYPPAPSWLPRPTESPSRMVFACDGVFTSAQDPEAFSAAIVKDVENPIVSALNRGIASTVVPTSWANFPLFTSGTPQNTQGGTLAGTYYYVMTALDAAGNESTPSFEWMTPVDGTTNNSVLLQWKPQGTDVVSAFKIYRGTSPGQENVLVATVPNNLKTPPTSYPDTGSGGTSASLPYRYYAPGSTSNLYAKFLHENSSDGPGGISIHSLVYGFPYDDQGGSSTNIGFPTMPKSVTITLQPWSGH